MATKKKAAPGTLPQVKPQKKFPPEVLKVVYDNKGAIDVLIVEGGRCITDPAEISEFLAAHK
jgi:hypothetical protein